MIRFSPFRHLHLGQRTLLILAALLLSACTALTPLIEDSSAPARKNDAAAHDDLRAIAILQERLDHVAGPLLLKNASICKKQSRSLLGFTARNRYSYSAELSDVAQATLGLGEPLQVTAVMAGSGAERVGLRRGDNLIAVGNKPMPQGKNAEYDAPAVLAPFVVGQTSVKLTVQRDGRNLTLSVPLTRACGFRIELGNTDSVNMYADGRRVLVTRGMMNFVRSDEELAYVVANGIAHNLFGHAHKLQSTAATGDIINHLMQVRPDASRLPTLKPVPPAMDALADRLALYIVARAGLNVEGAAAFWQRLAVQHPAGEVGSFSANHPSTAQRIAAMEKAIGEIKRARVRKKSPKVVAKPVEQPAERAVEPSAEQTVVKTAEPAGQTEQTAEQAAEQSEPAAEQMPAKSARKKAAKPVRKSVKKSVKKAASKAPKKKAKKKAAK